MTYLWDFGDNGKSNEINPVHEYVDNAGRPASVPNLRDREFRRALRAAIIERQFDQKVQSELRGDVARR